MTRQAVGNALGRASRVSVLGLILVWMLLSTDSLPVHAAPLAYIPNSESNDVSVIDTATQKVVATIPVGEGPWGVAVHPTGNFAYVTNRLSSLGRGYPPSFHPGTISVIDTVSWTVVATPKVGVFPLGVVAHPSGQKVYVANSLDMTISVIDTATHRVKATVTVPEQPLEGLAVDPSGKRLYVATWIGLLVIDALTDTLLGTVPFEAGAYGVTVHPEGRFIYATTQCVLIDEDDFEMTSFFVALDTATDQTVTRVPLPCGASGIAVHPAGTAVYVASGSEDTVSVHLIDTATYTITVSVVVPVFWPSNSLVPVSWPVGLAVHPEGTQVYVANIHGDADFGGTVAVIETAATTLTASIPVGTAPVAFGSFIGPAVSGSCLGTAGGASREP